MKPSSASLLLLVLSVLQRTSARPVAANGATAGTAEMDQAPTADFPPASYSYLPVAAGATVEAAAAAAAGPASPPAPPTAHRRQSTGTALCGAWDHLTTAAEMAVFLHDGHCAVGHLSGRNTIQPTLDDCARQCIGNSQCGFIAWNSDTHHTCALYNVADNCPDDDRHGDYNAYTVVDTRDGVANVAPLASALAALEG